MNKKIFIFKMLLFGILIVVGQWAVSLFAPPDLPVLIVRVHEIIKKQPDIIGMGDSSIFHGAPDDKNKDTIYEMLAQRVPYYSIEGLVKASFHLELYEHYCRYISKSAHQPKLIIVPINFRSFSPQWDKNPQYEAKAEKYSLVFEHPLFHIFYQPLSVFKLFEPQIKEYDYHNSLIYNGDQVAGRVKDFTFYDSVVTHKYRRDKFLFHYMYHLSAKHRKVQSLVNISKICRNNNIKVIFYITPIDYQIGEAYHPHQFIKRLEHNIAVIKQVAKENSFDVLDLTFGVDAQKFTWPKSPGDAYTPNEHLTEYGRMYVAEQLAKEIQKVMSE